MAAGVVVWGDGEFPSQRIDWSLIVGRSDAEGFARKVESTPRTVFGNTDIGDGIWSALDMLAGPGCARSGPSSTFRETERKPSRQNGCRCLLCPWRESAEQMDVTINGLVVADDGGDLASYYADKVIVGSNAYVMGVSSYSEYAAAIRAN